MKSKNYYYDSIHQIQDVIAEEIAKYWPFLLIIGVLLFWILYKVLWG